MVSSISLGGPNYDETNNEVPKTKTYRVKTLKPNNNSYNTRHVYYLRDSVNVLNNSLK